MSGPLLALRSGVEDLIYLSQGLRDHPATLLYRIIPGSLVLFLKGRYKRQCNMQLHTCQTVPGMAIPEGWSTQGKTFKCCLAKIPHLAFPPWRISPQHLELEHCGYESMIISEDEIPLRWKRV